MPPTRRDSAERRAHSKLARTRRQAKGSPGCKDAALRDGEGVPTMSSSWAAPRPSVDVRGSGPAAICCCGGLPANPPEDPLDVAAKRIAGQTGERLAAAGVLAVLVDGDGRLVAANAPFSDRALGGTVSAKRPPLFADLIEAPAEGSVRLVAEGPDARPMRVVSVPIEIGQTSVGRDLADVRLRTKGRASPARPMSRCCWKCCRSGWRWSIATAAS